MFKFLDKLALNKGLMLLLCSITLALLCVELCVAVKRGRLYARKVVTTAAQAIVIVAVMAGIGFLLSLLPLQGVGAQVVFYAALALVLAAVVVFYIVGERKAVRVATANVLRKSAGNTASVRHAKGWLYGAGIAHIIVAAVALAMGRADYYLAMFPVAVVAVAVLLNRILPIRIWYALAAVALIAFFVFTFFAEIISAKLLSLVIVAPALACTAMLALACVTLILKRE